MYKRQGTHRLRFLLAPMVHWPEVMAAYAEEEKILFSADAFGRFGSLERTARAPWAPQARRSYYNIVGTYSAQVQALLKKIAALEIDVYKRQCRSWATRTARSRPVRSLSSFLPSGCVPSARRRRINL